MTYPLPGDMSHERQRADQDHAATERWDAKVAWHSEVEAKARALCGDEAVDAITAAYGLKRESLTANTRRLERLVRERSKG